MKNEGLVDLNKLRSLNNKADFHGKSAYCFLQGDKIIKIYASLADAKFDILDAQYIPNLSKYHNKTIVFPDSYIYENGVKAGEIMKYIPDKSLYELMYDDFLVNLFMKNYDVALKDIKKYSNILMKDLCSVNILYSNDNGFHIIDTSEWKMFDRNTVYRNTKRFNETIINYLFEYVEMPVSYRGDYPVFDETFKRNTQRFGYLGQELFNIIECNAHETYDIKELLCAYKALFQYYRDKDLKTLSDVKELTKVLKKG